MKVKIIGITGPSGSGKNFICSILEREGIAVVDADVAARQAMETDSPCLNELKEAFGNILTKTGELDRRKLAKKAFETRENTEKLNRITLPHIMGIIKKKLEYLRETGAKIVLLNAPLLFEAKANELCDKSIVILADREIRINRLKKREKINGVELERRLKAGKDDKYYRSFADMVLFNNSDNEDSAEVQKNIELLKGIIKI